MADSSPTGNGSSFAAYDSTSDAHGVIGFRTLTAAEQVTTAQISNPANGGATPLTANFLTVGDVTLAGTTNQIYTLTMAPGSRLVMAPGQALTVQSGSVLVRDGGTSVITGGLWTKTLTYAVGGGTLVLDSPLPDNSDWVENGVGLLRVTARQWRSGFTANAGPLEVGPGDPLRDSDVSLSGTGHFDVGSAATRIGTLNRTGTVNIAGGSLLVTGGNNINGTINTDITYNGTITGTGTFGTGNRPGATGEELILTAESPFAGTLAVNNRELIVKGRLLSLSALSIAGGRLTVENEGVQSIAPRLASVPVSMSSGQLEVHQVPTSSQSAAFGTLTGEGFNMITTNSTGTPGAGVVAQLTFDSLARQNRGVFKFNLPASARYLLATDPTPLLIGNPAVPTARPVLPFATVNSHPATYEPGVGLRALTAAEQTTTIVTGQNVVLATTKTLNAPDTINSLEISGAVGVNGTGTLTVTSGLIALNGFISVPLDFGAAEGMIFLNGFSSVIGGKISGTSGLTVSGGTLTLDLQGSNDFTGPLTVNGGTVLFTTLVNLGADATPITLAGGGLSYNGAGTFDLSRGLNLRAGGGKLDAAKSNNALSVSSVISGPGSLTVTGSIALTNPANSYTGQTNVAGTLALASDSVFGNTSAIVASSALNLGVLKLAGDWTTSRSIYLENNLAVDTAGFNAVLNGDLGGDTLFTKRGAGTLILTGGATYTGSVVVEGGTLQVDGALGTRTSMNVTVNAGARLSGVATLPKALAVSGTLAPGDGIGALQTGSVTFTSGSTLELQVAGGNSYDQLLVNGTVTFSGLTQLAFGDLDNGGLPASWPLLLNDGSDAITTSATKGLAIGSTVLTEGSSFLLDGAMVQITYHGGDGNDIYLSVPEPESIFLISVGALGLLARRPRNRHSSQPRQ